MNGAGSRSLSPASERSSDRSPRSVQDASAFKWLDPGPLEGVKSKKRTVLSLQRSCEEGSSLALSLSSRVVVKGLEHQEVQQLLQTLCQTHPDTKSAWRIEKHDELRLSCIAKGCGPIASQLEQARESRPHLLVVELLEAADEVLHAALAAYTGALVVVLVGVLSDEKLLFRNFTEHEFQVTSWKSQPQLLDVTLRGPSSPQIYPQPWMAELLETQLAPLYEEEFAADLKNLQQTQRGYGVKLGLLIQEQPAEEVPDLLGFVAYKPWGPPLPSASVCAVAVPAHCRGHGYGRDLMAVVEDHAAIAGEAACPGGSGLVRLSSLPTAVRFYTRLGYEIMEGESEGGLQTNPQEDDEDAPCVPMQRSCCRISALPAGTPAFEPWSPRRAKHLEDGPTWCPVEQLTA